MKDNNKNFAELFTLRIMKIALTTKILFIFLNLLFVLFQYVFCCTIFTKFVKLYSYC